jgi:hypothetical protein
VGGILKLIKKATLAGIFRGWMERLRQGSATGAVTKMFLSTEFDEIHPVPICHPSALRVPWLCHGDIFGG